MMIIKNKDKMFILR